MMALSSSTVFRVRRLPFGHNVDEIGGILERALQTSSEISGLQISSLAEDAYRKEEQIATLSFLRSVPALFTPTADNRRNNQWAVSLAETDCSPQANGPQALSFDTHFQGISALNTPTPREDAIDCVIVCGLGGHVFGSFKEKGGPYMWLRDSLPKDVSNLRILLYGYESTLEGSETNQNVSSIADSFIGHLNGLRDCSKPIMRPLIIIAHSLGGLVVKQAIIKLGRGNDLSKKQMQSIVGLLFFGVPHRGMNIGSLQSIVGDNSNRYLLESVGQYSDLLLEQDAQFSSTFHFKDSPVFSFYETKKSPTALKTSDGWKMMGPSDFLVPRVSATHSRLWESDLHHEGFNRTHSDLVKFSFGDMDYERVLCRLREISSNADVLLLSRFQTQETPDDLNRDEQACLRSLSFDTMNAREMNIEPATEHTGNWLLESNNFQTWVRRERLKQHRGFFWIQGNPGSGKSTLMKNAYLHVKATSTDKSSIIAAFFFNARGTSEEKSPMGLFRTLTHTLCQYSRAFRALVVSAYVEKSRKIRTGWEWQFGEIKTLLKAIVKSSVLGQRNLVLFVDALDECDLAGARSVILFFQELASFAVSEDTKFSICLSSRYYPQFTIQNCFRARVEIENKGDISTYIHSKLPLVHAINDNVHHWDKLKKEILQNANGTFLWVVLVVQELLQDVGATPGELRKAVHKIPTQLEGFYKNQLRSSDPDSRLSTLRLLQCVLYSQRPLSPRELRFALGIGCGACSSYAEWSQSSEYVHDQQMEKRIREHSKGLVEIRTLQSERRESVNGYVPVQASEVQFIHETVREFLDADGLRYLGQRGPYNQKAEGHEFLKGLCMSYLNIREVQIVPVIDCSLYTDSGVQRRMPTLLQDHPLLDYATKNVFEHAAQAEQHGIRQDEFRIHMNCNNQGTFERWSYLFNLFQMYTGMELSDPGGWTTGASYWKSPRPFHYFAQYGLLAPGMAKLEEDPNTEGGPYRYALLAAAANGHTDTVRYLLNMGADPEVSNGEYVTSFHWAAWRGDVDLLSHLLKHPLSIMSLQQRLDIASYVRAQKSRHHEFLELLISEASIPVSAIGESSLLWDDEVDKLVFTYILDKCDRSVFDHEHVWDACWIILGFQDLLDRVGILAITERLEVASSDEHPNFDAEFVEPTVSLMLSEHMKVEPTENLINCISCLENSSQLLRRLAAQSEIPPLTRHQILTILERGSAESVTFLVQNSCHIVSADEMLLAAVENHKHADQVVRVLLAARSFDHIKEDILVASLANWNHANNLIRIFEDQWGSLTFSDRSLMTAIKHCGLEMVKHVLSRHQGSTLIEDLLISRLNEKPYDETFDLLLEQCPSFHARDNFFEKFRPGARVFPFIQALLRHGKILVLTEKIVEALARDHYGCDSLALILNQVSGAEVSDSMILIALKAADSAKLVTFLLDHAPYIIMREEFLVAAASNPYKGSKILEAWHRSGRIRGCPSSPGATGIAPAKRQRISHDPSSRRKQEVGPPHITKKVIEAAATNGSNRQRRLLLSLFQTWGLLTENDRSLFRQPTGSMELDDDIDSSD